MSRMWTCWSPCFHCQRPIFPELLCAPSSTAATCALQLTHAALRGAVAAVPQYVNLVDRSVAANIAFGLCVLFFYYLTTAGLPG